MPTFQNERSVAYRHAPLARGLGVDTTKPSAQTLEARLARQAIPLGQVRITSDSPEMFLQCDMDDKAWVPSDGFGGWQMDDRPRRKQRTWWKGAKTFKLVGGVVLDRWSEDESVEPEISVLESMAQVPPGQEEPPLLMIDGGGAIPHDVRNDPSALWFLEDIQYTEQRWNDHHQRSLIIATLTFYQYQETAYAPTGTVPKPARSRTYRVKQGDTLVSIAARVLKNKNKWHDLARLNKIRDPRAVKPGQVIKLP